MWRSRAPLWVGLLLAARSGQLIQDADGNCAVVEPPSRGESPPVPAGTRWLRLVDSCWDVLGFALIPTLLLLATLPAFWVPTYAPVGLILVSLALLAVVVPMGLTAVLQ